MSLEQLLRVQSIDVESRQLRHRRETLEQRSELAASSVRRAEEQLSIDEVAALRVEAASRQRRLEDEAQIVAAKVADDSARLYSGEVTGMKDLQALQHEIDHLKARQESIEDDALSAMEEAEAFTNRVTDMEQSCSGLDQRITELLDEIAAAEHEIDERLAALVLERGSVTAEVDPSMIEEYEQLRPGFGLATVVRFDGHKCVGCPSVMPSVEIDRLKHADGGILEHCSECGRMVLT